MGKNQKGKNRKNNNKKKQPAEESLDISGILDLATGFMGATAGGSKKKNNDAVDMNDIFNIASDVVKESNLSDRVSELSKNKNLNAANLGDLSQKAGIFDMITELIDEEDQQNAGPNVQKQIKKLRRRINQMDKELTALKEKLKND